ncbi:hypothetical protein FFLO_06183 [Filobasidium floriforme]|uniref:Uncharacterized protein n=1 Tax=Filobasidium floriforme TaxID=5210 RepID=A0A8K0JFV0_9TREE|nr:uncharacterized protein HD553DRAFT_349013 [Filobasidium floriforme]KAG7528392.1 hypothetical protein FFLO_06183 [Filobasidium floriforme]KAH8086786.1 hypothetical protein HD553DRAFT_349013 [Filobasidium floriforme]
MPNPNPMFLPSRLAYRFLHEYSRVIFPVLDLVAIERSIGASFDTSRPGARRPFPDIASPRVERARDMLVLAFGAQVISGDGDADCPKDIAVVWSETLFRAAYGIMNDMGAFEGGVDLIRSWIIYAEFSLSHGNSGAEFETMNTAARSITRMGLHKRGTYEFDVAEVNDYRTVFANSRLSVMLKLARLADEVQRAGPVVGRSGYQTSARSVRTGLGFSRRGGRSLWDAVEHLRIELPREFDRDGDYQRTLVLFTIYGMYLQYVEALADECVKTACETIDMFERHIAMYPHTPELSLSSIFMLYAVSIVYMDVLRLPVVVASTRHAGHIESALKSLEHYDHPAATLAEASPPPAPPRAMCRDLLVNFIDETAAHCGPPRPRLRRIAFSWRIRQSVTSAMPSYHARDPTQYTVASRTPNAATAEGSSTIFLQFNGPNLSLRSIYTTASHKNGQLQLYEQIDSNSTKTWYVMTLQGEFKLNFSPGREREATENDDATQIASSRMQQRVERLKSRWTLLVGLVDSEKLSGIPEDPAFFRLAQNWEVDSFLGQKQIARLTKELLVPLTLLSRSDASSHTPIRDDTVWTQVNISQVINSIAFLEEWMLALDVARSVADLLKLEAGTRLSSYERLNSGVILSLYGQSKFMRPYFGEA